MANEHALPIGTRLEEFEILGLVGEGGFGIVYLAFDHSLQRRVALKEYMPSSLASRLHGGQTVTVRSVSDTETFSLGLRSFVNESRLLAQFEHPALLKVYRFWEGNGTAYMAMPFYEGLTLKQALASGGFRPDQASLHLLILPLLNALTVLHTSQCFHRDIAPDNILLTPSGPLLLDFGAARRVIGDASQMLTAILKEGYAPIEQYGTSAGMRQGPWTDIYALCGVLRYAITGAKPVSAIDRLYADSMPPLREIAAGRYSSAFLAAIDTGLAVRPESRPQSIGQFHALIEGTDGASAIGNGPEATRIQKRAPGAVPSIDIAHGRRPAAPPPPGMPVSAPEGGSEPARTALRVPTPAPVVLIQPSAHPPSPTTTSSRAPAASRSGLWASIVVVVFVGAAGTVWWQSRPSGSAAGPATSTPVPAQSPAAPSVDPNAMVKDFLAQGNWSDAAISHFNSSWWSLSDPEVAAILNAPDIQALRSAVRTRLHDRPGRAPDEPIVLLARNLNVEISPGDVSIGARAAPAPATPSTRAR